MGSVWVAAVCAFGLWAVDAVAKTGLMRTGVPVVLGVYGVLALPGGWALGRAFPQSSFVLAFFYLFISAAAGAFLLVLVGTGQSIRRAMEMEKQFPSVWPPLLEKVRACSEKTDDAQEKDAIEDLYKAVEQAQKQEDTHLEPDFFDVVRRLGKTMEQPKSADRRASVCELCQEGVRVNGPQALKSAGPEGE